MLRSFPPLFVAGQVRFLFSPMVFAFLDSVTTNRYIGSNGKAKLEALRKGKFIVKQKDLSSARPDSSLAFVVLQDVKMDSSERKPRSKVWKVLVD